MPTTFTARDAMRKLALEGATAIADKAARTGHVLSIGHRPPPPEVPDGNHKHWAECTCGWKSRNWAAKGAALHAMINHMAREAADADTEAARLRKLGVVPYPLRPSVPYVAPTGSHEGVSA